MNIHTARAAKSPANQNPANATASPNGHDAVAMDTDPAANESAPAPAASVTGESDASVSSHMADLAAGVKLYAPVLEKGNGQNQNQGLGCCFFF
jgi:hypothetical protein